MFTISITVWRYYYCPRGVLWYIPTYIGLGYFFVFKILNFNIFWGFEKNEYLEGGGGYEDFVDIFLGSS